MITLIELSFYFIIQKFSSMYKIMYPISLTLFSRCRSWIRIDSFRMSFDDFFLWLLFLHFNAFFWANFCYVFKNSLHQRVFLEMLQKRRCSNIRFHFSMIGFSSEFLRNKVSRKQWVSWFTVSSSRDTFFTLHSLISLIFSCSAYH